MAIYHLHLSNGSKSGGASAQIRHAYLVREGEYKGREDELVYKESNNLPSWAKSEQDFWSAADTHERKNARVYREFEMALPKELNEREQVKLAQEFARDLTQEHKLAYTMAIHSKQGHNPHVHVMYSERRDDGVEREKELHFKRANKEQPWKGGAAKVPEMRGKQWLNEVRQQWEVSANLALEQAKRPERIDCRSYEAQGINRTPQVHLGVQASAMARRGVETERLVQYKQIEQVQNLEKALERFEKERQELAKQASQRKEHEYGEGRIEPKGRAVDHELGEPSQRASRDQQAGLPTQPTPLPSPGEYGVEERQRRARLEAARERAQRLSEARPGNAHGASRRPLDLGENVQHSKPAHPRQAPRPPEPDSRAGQPTPQREQPALQRHASNQDGHSKAGPEVGGPGGGVWGGVQPMHVDGSEVRAQQGGERGREEDSQESGAFIQRLLELERAREKRHRDTLRERQELDAARARRREEERRIQEHQKEAQKEKEPKKEVDKWLQEFDVKQAALALGSQYQKQGLVMADETTRLQKAEVLEIKRVHGQTIVALKSEDAYKVFVNPKSFERTFEVKDKEVEPGWARVSTYTYQKGEHVEFSKDGIVVNAQKSQAQKRACEREARLQRQQSRSKGKDRGWDFER